MSNEEKAIAGRAKSAAERAEKLAKKIAEEGPQPEPTKTFTPEEVAALISEINERSGGAPIKVQHLRRITTKLERVGDILAQDVYAYVDAYKPTGGRTVATVIIEGIVITAQSICNNHDTFVRSTGYALALEALLKQLRSVQ